MPRIRAILVAAFIVILSAGLGAGVAWRWLLRDALAKRAGKPLSWSELTRLGPRAWRDIARGIAFLPIAWGQVLTILAPYLAFPHGPRGGARWASVLPGLFPMQDSPSEWSLWEWAPASPRVMVSLWAACIALLGVLVAVLFAWRPRGRSWARRLWQSTQVAAAFTVAMGVGTLAFFAAAQWHYLPSSLAEGTLRSSLFGDYASVAPALLIAPAMGTLAALWTIVHRFEVSEVPEIQTPARGHGIFALALVSSIATCALWGLAIELLVSPPPHGPYLREGIDFSFEVCRPDEPLIAERNRERYGDSLATRVRCDGGISGAWARVEGGALAWCGLPQGPGLRLARVDTNPGPVIDFQSSSGTRALDVFDFDVVVLPSGLAVKMADRIVLYGADLEPRAEWGLPKEAQAPDVELLPNTEGVVVVWRRAHATRNVQLSNALVPLRSLDVRGNGPVGVSPTPLPINRNLCFYDDPIEATLVLGPDFRPVTPGLGERVLVRGGSRLWILGIVAVLMVVLAARAARALRAPTAIRDEALRRMIVLGVLCNLVPLALVCLSLTWSVSQ